MKNNPLVSICIPTYNGGDYFERTMEQIVPYLSDAYEVIVSDDCSIDGTYELALRYSARYQRVNVYKNSKNIGMDRNFHKSATLSSGKYIWFCGQDDLLGKEIIEEVEKTLKLRDLTILNINFSQYDHDMKSCLLNSFFERTAFNRDFLKKGPLLVFNGADEYFRTFTQPPSFLPSVVMLRKYWSDSDAEKYYGTHFVQVGLVLQNLGKGPVGAYTKPLIKGRVPNDQWQSNGNKLFDIMTGDILAKKIAFESNESLPVYILNRDIKKYTLNYIFLVYECRVRGLKTEAINFLALKKIYKDSPVYWLYIFPVAIMPRSVLKIAIIPLRFVKKILLKFPAIERLRG